MKKILLISHSFPPLLTANSIQVGNWVAALSRGNFFFTVISVAPRYTTEKAAMDRIDSEKVKVHRTFSPESLFEGLKLAGIIRKVAPSLLHKPDDKAFWVPFALAHIRNKIDSEEIDVLISCSHYLSNHQVALSLQRWLREKGRIIPWIAHFSDPWTESIYFTSHNTRHQQWNIEKEREILSAATGLTFPCEELRDVMISSVEEASREKIKIKSTIIPHSYNQASYKVPPHSVQNDNTIKLIHTGSFYGPRSPLPLLEAIEKLKHESHLPGYKLILVGAHESWKEVIDKMELGTVVEVLPRVSYRESIDYILAADYLVMIDGSCEGHKSVFFPSKLADYLGSGIPVFGLTPKGSAAWRILSHYNQARININDSGAITLFIKELLEGTTTLQHYTPPGELSSEAVASAWAETIEKAIAARHNKE